MNTIVYVDTLLLSENTHTGFIFITNTFLYVFFLHLKMIVCISFLILLSFRIVLFRLINLFFFFIVFIFIYLLKLES